MIACIETWLNWLLEFAKLHGDQKKPQEQESDMKRAFRIFDDNNKGYIESAELRHIILNMDSRIPREELQEMITSFKLDQNKRVSYQGKTYLYCYWLLITRKQLWTGGCWGGGDDANDDACVPSSNVSVSSLQYIDTLLKLFFAITSHLFVSQNFLLFLTRWEKNEKRVIHNIQWLTQQGKGNNVSKSQSRNPPILLG